MPLLSIVLGAEATPVAPPGFSGRCSQVTFQAYSANPVYVGNDAALTADNGMVLNAGTPGGSCDIGAESYLESWYVLGTAGDVVRVLFVPAL